MCVEKHRPAIMQPCARLDSQPGRLICHARQISMRSWNCPLEHDGRKKHVEMYCRGKHNQLHIPNNSAPLPETKNKASTPSPAGAVTTHDCPAELPLASGAHRIRAVVHCYWGCATGCACLDSTFPHVSFGHHALGDNSTISLIFAWHGNLACQVTSPNVCMAAFFYFFIFFGRDGHSLHKCNDNNLKET